jgi:urate oxidase
MAMKFKPIYPHLAEITLRAEVEPWDWLEQHYGFYVGCGWSYEQYDAETNISTYSFNSVENRNWFLLHFS